MRRVRAEVRANKEVVADHPRIEELRRRVEKDPASLAFAHLAEVYRRAGRHAEAVATCRAGLTFHPTYVSARVTLGRSLIEIGDLDAAQSELQAVMSAAPDNLAAIRGLADIHQRRGQLQEALDYYRWAQEFAGRDPDLEQRVRELTVSVERGARAETRLPLQAVTPPQAAHPRASDAEARGTSVPPEPADTVPDPSAFQVRRAGEREEAERRLAVFRRFLETVLADRERRQAGR